METEAEPANEVALGSLAVGALVAEGGEGRVHQLPGRPDLLLKAYKTPVPLAPLRQLVAWPGRLAAADAALGARVQVATAWPRAVVVDGSAGEERAAGLLIGRAPRRFWLRHRDGTSRLATLSYLTADPGQRRAAYGLQLPDPMDPARLGLAYALARLLAAFEAASPPAVHGDLSAKNVLWSLERGPELYLIDCDNAALYGDDAGEEEGRRRAMTPNWDDPAVAAGANPDRYSDRYSLALVFLRIAGAAHFPLQARQRKGEPLAIDFEVPASLRRAPALQRGAPLWRCCEWGLNTLEPARRPAAGVWAALLEEALLDMGADDVVERVQAAQEGPGLAAASPQATLEAPSGPPGIHVRPVAPSPRLQAWRLVTATSTEADGAVDELGPAEAMRRAARFAVTWWWLAHRRMARSLLLPGRRTAGTRRLVFLTFVDLCLASVALFLFAMIVSPFLGL